jgi:hypothetical protein
VLRALSSSVRSRRGARRTVSGVLATVVAVPLAWSLAGAHGLTGAHAELAGGQAWLASPAQGLITLVDGASAQVVGSVRVPPSSAGHDFTVAQQDSTAYLVDATGGTVSRVDGGTYETSPPVRFGAGGSLQVYLGRDTAYVVDGQRRVAAVIDPATLRVRNRLSLAVRPGPRQSVVDDAGRLWVVTGAGLTWFDQAGQHVAPDLGDPAAQLVLVGGKATLVQPDRGRAGTLTDKGTVPRWSCLQVPPGATPALLGSTALDRVVAVVPATGTLVLAGTGNDGCGQTVDVGQPGDTFGPLVESDGFLFVPNRSRGRTTIVNLADRSVAAELDLVRPGAKLELLAKDGVVFYNDLDSDVAGVIRLEGGRWRGSGALHKFNPARSGDGILLPSGNSAKPGQTGVGGKKPTGTDPRKRPNPTPGNPAGNNQPPPPDPNQPDPVTPDQRQQPPAGQDPGHVDPGQQHPNQPDPGQPDQPTGPGTSPPTTSDPNTPVTPTPPVVSDLTWTPDPVGRGQAATFTATVTNTDADTVWAWAVVDPATGSTLQTATTAGSATFTLPPGSPASLEMHLDVRNGDAAAPTFVRTFSTKAGVVPHVSALTATPGSAAVGQTVTLHGVEDNVGANGVWEWTVSGPGATRTLPGNTPGQDVQTTFDTVATYEVTLKVTFDGAVSTKTIPVAVGDDAGLSAVTASPINLRSGGSATVTVRLDNAFTAQRVTVTTASWLSASAGSFTIAPGGTGSVTVTKVGTAPADGLNPNALGFRLDNGSVLNYDFLANTAPTDPSVNCIPTLDRNNIPVTVFSGSVSDAEPATVHAVLTVGPFSREMTLISTSGGQAGFSLQRQQNIGIGDTYSIEFTDAGGLTVTASGNRNDRSPPCWTNP